MARTRYITRAPFSFDGGRTWTWLEWSHDEPNVHAAVAAKAEQVGNVTHAAVSQAHHHEASDYPGGTFARGASRKSAMHGQVSAAEYKRRLEQKRDDPRAHPLERQLAREALALAPAAPRSRKRAPRTPKLPRQTPTQRQVLAIIDNAAADFERGHGHPGHGAAAPFQSAAHRAALRQLEKRGEVTITDRGRSEWWAQRDKRKPSRASSRTATTPGEAEARAGIGNPGPKDEALWARAKRIVRPHWDQYDQPWAVVQKVYRNLGGR